MIVIPPSLQVILDEAGVQVVDAPIPEECTDDLCRALNRCDCFNDLAVQVNTGDNPPERLVEAARKLYEAAEKRHCPILKRKER